MVDYCDFPRSRSLEGRGRAFEVESPALSKTIPGGTRRQPVSVLAGRFSVFANLRN